MTSDITPGQPGYYNDIIDISPFSDKCDGYFQRCDWYFQMLLVFSDLNHGLKACL